MATYHAIASIGEAILGILEAARPVDEFSTAEFKLYQFRDFQQTLNEGISLCLYRVTTNTSRRNLPPRRNSAGQRFRPSLPLDLHYLLTPWANDPAKQHNLLGWAMRTLEDTPILPAGILNHYGPQGETFQPEETVELICDPLSLQDTMNIWDPLKPNIQLCISYVARMVQIDSDLEIITPPPVQTRVFELNKEPDL